MAKKFITKERLNLSHSLVMGHTPKPIRDGKVNFGKHLEDNAVMDFDKFGFFDTSAPNFNNYYPDLKPEDLDPKDEEFIYPVFRALSEVLVRPMAPIDFTQNNVLKDSMYLLVGQAVYPNHEMITGDELGVVQNVEWGEARKVKNSKGDTVLVPAGMNATFKIDGKSNPRIARAINMDPPSIHSVSVTVEFEWEQSHPEMDRDEFFNKLGTFDEKGELIRRVATNILRYHEISLVPHGADPFAQKLDKDGNIVNPTYSGAVYSFSEVDKDTTLATPKDGISIDYSFKGYGKESFKEQTTILKQLNNNNKSESNMLKQFIEQLQAQFPNLDEAALEAKAQEMLTALTKVEELTSQVEGLTTEKTELEGQVQSLTEERDALQSQVDSNDNAEAVTVLQETVDLATEDARKEALRLCQLVNDNKAPESLTAQIEKSDYTGAKAFIEQFSVLYEEKLKGSGGAGGSEDEEDEEERVGTSSLEEAMAELTHEKTSAKTAGIHGKVNKV